MFTLKIKDLKAETILGIYDWEKKAVRPVVLNLELSLSDAITGHSDAMKDSVDYDLIEQRVLQHLSANSYNLIETLVSDIGKLVLSLDQRILSVRIEVDKPGALKSARSVSVSQLFARS